MRLREFTRAEKHAAEMLQNHWRAREAQRTLKELVRARKMMETCEDDYLRNPNRIEYLCNISVPLLRQA